MISPNRTAEELNLRGIHLYQQGRFAEAESCFDLATQLNACLAQAWSNRGLVAWALGQLAQSIQYMTRAIHLFPEDAKFYANRAMVRKEAKDLEGALADLTLALAYANTEDQKRWLLERATIRRDLGLLEEAVADCDALLDMDFAHAEAYETRGRLLIELEQYSAALNDLNRAIALCDVDRLPLVLHARAEIALARKRCQDAVADYDRALAIDPKYTLAYISRGHAQYHLRQFQKAEADYLQAMELDAKLTIHQLVRVIRKHAIENPAETLVNCRKHVRLQPKDYIARLRLAMTLSLLDLDEHSPERDESLSFVAGNAPELWAASQPVLEAIRNSGRLPL